MLLMLYLAYFPDRRRRTASQSLGIIDSTADRPYIRDTRIDADSYIAYRKREARMKALADADGDIFLPNPEPLGPPTTF
jgi:hypothetical protein